ncbi:MAG: 2'-deoxycytidine 5'-triphosphate deaminase [Nitrospinae bacterium]|nr:2'-deoxycytidine 5'-triphosphate deaminase [Nitrospinota bacterium]
MNLPPKGGVLPAADLTGLIDEGRIVHTTGGITPDHIDRAVQIQPASIDLRLGHVAYRLQSSFLPQQHLVQDRMQDLIMYKVDLNEGGILEREAVYLIPLVESLRLPSNIKGKTNPKSSTGRLDIFTRVITDCSNRFEDIAPGYAGHLYLEVVPRSFTVKVRTGMRLNQLRLFYVDTEPIQGQELRERYLNDQMLYTDDGEVFDSELAARFDGVLMGVDLTAPNGEGAPIGYRARKNSQVIDLDRVGAYDADDFWDPIMPPKSGRLILEPEEFYIFASKERIRVPLSCAAEMVEFDAGSGELRTHYAGFFDPGFGYGRAGEIKGTKAVLEVRPHDVPFAIEDGQVLFKMKYERMVAEPSIWYGAEIGSNYHNQTLRLAKQFTSGPERT